MKKEDRTVILFLLDSMYDQAIIKGKAYINNKWEEKNIYIIGEKIALISDKVLPAKKVIDASGYEVLPGIIDPHVHFELDLGFIKSVDNFYSGSVAAAYGGVTSYVDFLEPVDCVKDLEPAFKRRLALAEKSVVDYHFHATIKCPKGNLEDFVKKMKELGMNTLKIFTTYSDSGRRTYDKEIIELLNLSKKYKFLIMAHIENDDLIDLNPKFTHKDLTISRSSESETTEVLKIAQFVRETKGWLYMAHLSSGETLRRLVEEFTDILNTHFIVESCPQYFSFNKDVLLKEKGELYTFAPPLRSQKENDLLFKYSNYVYTIGTDHCAFMSEDKKKQFLHETPLGIGAVEHSLNVMRHHLGDDVLTKMTDRVAYTQGFRTKGEIKVGFDADFVIYQTDEEAKCLNNHGTCDYSIFKNYPAAGKVISTMVRGKFIINEGKFVGGKGKWIKGSDFN